HTKLHPTSPSGLKRSQGRSSSLLKTFHHFFLRKLLVLERVLQKYYLPFPYFSFEKKGFVVFFSCNLNRYATHTKLSLHSFDQMNCSLLHPYIFKFIFYLSQRFY